MFETPRPKKTLINSANKKEPKRDGNIEVYTAAIKIHWLGIYILLEVEHKTLKTNNRINKQSKRKNKSRIIKY